MQHDANGNVTEVGARTRTIPPALRRALQHRDRGCRFPGCARAFGQGHHIRIGPTEAPPRCRISRCCVAAITARCTKRAIRWSDRLMESCASGDRTGGHCRTFRRPPRCRAIPSTRCERHTTLKGSTFTRGRRCRAGRVSDSTSAMPSACCIRSRPAPERAPREDWPASADQAANNERTARELRDRLADKRTRARWIPRPRPPHPPPPPTSPPPTQML